MRLHLVVLVGLTCAVNAATLEDAKRELTALEADAKALIVQRDVLAAAVPESANSGLLDLTAAKLVAGGDLALRLLRKDGAVTAAWAVAADWNPMSHRVEVRALDWSADRVSGELVLHLVPWTDRHVLRAHASSPYIQPYGSFLTPWGPPEAPVVRDGQAIPVVVKLAVALGARSVTGTLTAVDPSVAPLADGPVPVTGRFVAAGRPVFPAMPEGAGASLFAMGVEAADQARLAYEQIRAIEVQTRTGLPALEAFARVPHARLTWSDPLARPDVGKGREPPKKPRKSDQPSLDDALGELPFTGVEDVTAKTAKEQPRQSAQVFTALQAMRAQVARYAAALRRHQAEGVAAAALPVQRGDVDAGDPEFAPGGVVTVLPVQGDQVAVLPATTGQAGPVAWGIQGFWKVVGPFPSPDLACPSPLLPDLVADPSALLVVDQAAFPWRHSSGHQYWGDGTSAWRTIQADPVTGQLTPPIWVKKDYPYFGIDYGGFYAVGQIQAPQAVEAWAALTFKDRACVWLEDRLLWTSVEDGDITRSQRTCRFRLPLAAGLNRVTVRVDGNQRPVWISLMLCTQGGPRPAGEAAAALAARRAQPVADPRAGTIGWRGDGTGRFPEADPPLAWDLDRKINVRWAADIGEGWASPLLLGDRIITTAQPCDIVCCAADDGRVLWRRHADPLEFSDPDQGGMRSRELFAAWDDPAQAGQRAAIRKQIDDLWAERAKAGKRTLGKFQPDGGYNGPMLPTPVSDGKRIVVKVGAEAVVCLDRDGRVQWGCIVPKTGGGMGAVTPSPVIAGDRLYLQVPRYVGGPEQPVGTDDDEPPPIDGAFVDRRSGRRYALACHDLADGRCLWVTEGIEGHHFGNRYDADGLGTPVPLRLGDGKQTLDVIVLAGSGAVIRADDGAVLLTRCGGRTNCATPIPLGDGTLLFTEGDVRAVRLLLRSRDRVEAQVLYSRALPKRTSAYSGALLAADRLWISDGDFLLGFDPASGRQVVQIDRIYRRANSEDYAPLVLAGRAIVMGDTARNDHNKHAAWKNGSLPPDQRIAPIPGVMSLIAPGAVPLVLARNAMWGVTSSPVADGDRLFVRSHRELYCLGRTGAEGARYEGQRVARCLLAQIPPAPPASDPDPVCPTPAPSLPYNYRPGLFEPGWILTGWDLLGPLDATAAATAEREQKLPAAPAFLGRKGAVPVAGAEVPLRSIRIKDIYRYPSELMVDPQEEGPAYDPALVHGAVAGSTVWWGCYLMVERPQTLRVDLGGAPGGRLWIGGQELRQGQRVRLVRGHHLFVMKTLVEDAESARPFRPCLWPAETPERERAQRQAVIAAARPWLEKAVAAGADLPEVRVLLGGQ